MTSAGTEPNQRERAKPVPRPGSDPNALTAIGKINLETGEIQRINVGRVAFRWRRCSSPPATCSSRAI